MISVAWIVDFFRRVSGNGDIARRGERVAGRYLKKKGYRVLGRNVQLGVGEIDLLVEAPDGRTVVIVEVKSTAAGESTRGELRPEGRVGRNKQMQLTRLADQVMKRKGYRDRPIRFDVVGVEFNEGESVIVRHHEGAFESVV